MPTPAHSQPDRSTRQGPVTRSPSPRPASSTATSSLFQLATPATMPTASHHRPSRRSSARIGEQGDQRPDHEIDGCREQHVPEHHRERCRGRRPCAQRLRAPRSADLPGDQRHDEHGRDGRRGPTGMRRNHGSSITADQRLGDQRGQRWEVDVAPCGVEHAEVQLVAVVSVTLGGHGQHHRDRGHRAEHGAARERRQRGRGALGPLPGRPEEAGRRGVGSVRRQPTSCAHVSGAGPRRRACAALTRMSGCPAWDIRSLVVRRSAGRPTARRPRPRHRPCAARSASRRAPLGWTTTSPCVAASSASRSVAACSNCELYRRQ